MGICIKPARNRLSAPAILAFLFCLAALARPLAAKTFSVMVYAAKGSAKADFPKKGVGGTLVISGSTIQFFYLRSGRPFLRVAQVDEISEIRKDSTGWFEIVLKNGRYKFCARTETDACAAPVEPIIEALSAAVSGTAQELPEASEAMLKPLTPHHFAPIPRPNGNRLTLEQTMRYIQEELGGLARVKYTMYVQRRTDSTDQTAYSDRTEEATNVRASAAGCQIDHHRRQVDENNVGTDIDVSTSLTEVDHVVIMPAEQYWSTRISMDINQEFTYWPDPPFFEVVLGLKNGLNDPFPLYDEREAHRIAEALEHAIEFCRSAPS